MYERVSVRSVCVCEGGGCCSACPFGSYVPRSTDSSLCGGGQRRVILRQVRKVQVQLLLMNKNARFSASLTKWCHIISYSCTVLFFIVQERNVHTRVSPFGYVLLIAAPPSFSFPRCGVDGRPGLPHRDGGVPIRDPQDHFGRLSRLAEGSEGHLVQVPYYTTPHGSLQDHHVMRCTGSISLRQPAAAAAADPEEEAETAPP